MGSQVRRAAPPRGARGRDGHQGLGSGARTCEAMLTNVCFMAERPSFHVTVNTPLCVSGISYKESRRRIWSNASGVVTVVTAGRRGCLSGGFSRHPRQSDREGDRATGRERGTKALTAVPGQLPPRPLSGASVVAGAPAHCHLLSRFPEFPSLFTASPSLQESTCCEAHHEAGSGSDWPGLPVGAPGWGRSADGGRHLLRADSRPRPQR